MVIYKIRCKGCL